MDDSSKGGFNILTGRCKLSAPFCIVRQFGLLLVFKRHMLMGYLFIETNYIVILLMNIRSKHDLGLGSFI